MKIRIENSCKKKTREILEAKNNVSEIIVVRKLKWFEDYKG